MAELFRKVALERQSSPEQLDVLMQVTSPKGWISLLAAGGLLACAIVWGCLGSIPVKVTGQGMLMRAGGIYEIVSSGSGEVTGLYVEAGDIIEKGRTVARVGGSDGATTEEETSSRVVSPFTGRVLELTIRVGETVTRGAPLMKVELVGPDGGGMQAVMYFPAGSGEKIRPGMEAEIWPAVVERAEYGFLQGLVSRVSEYPSSPEGMMLMLRNEILVEALSREGAPIEIRADLVADPSTPSGYRWSSSRSPDITLRTGTICSGSVTVSRQRPISLVVPFLGRFLGSG